jgi:large subunit ribosomal protein L10
MRPEKTAMLEEARSMVADSEFALMVDYSGLNVERISELRGKLEEAGAEMHVTKNRLLNIIAKDNGWDGLDSLLTGPTATIVGTNDQAAAKVVKEFAKTDARPKMKAGIINNELLGPDEIAAFANLPSLEALRTMVVGTLAAPMSQLVTVMNQKLASIVYVLKAAADKKA